MKKIVAAICLLIVCIPVFAFAHPGHGSTGGFTIIHYIVEPVHAFYTAGIIVSCVVYFRFLAKTRREEQSL